MFYLTKKQIGEIKEGDECVVLADFSGVPAGTRGTIYENYQNGVMVEWHLPHPPYGRPLMDGFGEDELHYLAFGTPKCPERFLEDEFIAAAKEDPEKALVYLRTHV